MADEEVVVAVEPAPVPEVTATPAADVSKEPEAKPAEPVKLFSQEELDAAVGKRLAREQRKWEREHAQRVPVAPVVADEVTDPPAEVQVLAEKLATERELVRQNTQILEAYHEREESARERYDDFDQVAYSPTLPITAVMAETIRGSDVGPEIAYYLGTNPAEAKRIAQLTPLSQAKELGKLEDKLASNPPAKKTSSAPAPIAPLAGRVSSTPTFDTTDPRSIASMSTSEWIAKERERQVKRHNSTSR